MNKEKLKRNLTEMNTSRYLVDTILSISICIICYIKYYTLEFLYLYSILYSFH